MMLQDELIKAALEAGADKATVIDASGVVLSAAFLDHCKGNQCGNYGKKWSCPPYPDGDIYQLMDEVRSFRFCLLYQTICQLEDSFDVEGMAAAGKKLCAIGQKLNNRLPKLLTMPYKHLGGLCQLCQQCARSTGEPCRYPKQAIRTLSGYGIDVYNTTAATDLRYTNGQNTVTDFGMVLYTE